MSKSRLIAKLDPQGRLVGTRRGTPKDGEVVLPDDCDLPTDGTYRWENGAFWPLGHGHPRVSEVPPVSKERALYDLIRAMGKKAPPTSSQWADWYEKHLKQREEETALAVARRPRR